MTMRIKIRSHLFLLFGVQGILQVIYWEMIKGYPACFMCKGYRVLYISILMTALIYHYRASVFRLLLLCGLSVMESLWSLWDVVQKMGHLAQKCHSSWNIVDGHSVFASCQSSQGTLLKLFLSPVGINAILSQLMFGYVVYVLWRLKFCRIKAARWGLVLTSLLFQESSATSHKDVNTAIQKAVNAQARQAKTFEADLHDLHETATVNAKRYEKEARKLKAPLSPDAVADAKSILQTKPCTGKCPSFTPNTDGDPPLQVCMSFSVPLQVWKALNEDLIRHQGVFVVKGLPNNSFQAFAKKVLEFRKLGVTAPIQIAPKLFERLNVNHVPLFVVHDGDELHTVSGTLTIPYVMDLIHLKTGEGR